MIYIQHQLERLRQEMEKTLPGITNLIIPSTDMTYMQHQFERSRQEMEKNTARNNEFKNLIKKT